MARNAFLVRDIAAALEKAGVISDIDSITRIVIDLDPVRLPEIHIQRVGDERLLGIVPMLAEARVTEQPKAVRYWVLVSDELMSGEHGGPHWPSSLRPVRPDESAPPPDGHSRWWLFEDDDAPPELAGKRVELIIGCGQTDEGGPYVNRIERRVVA